MAERKRRISLIVAAGVLVMASASAAVTAMAFLAVESAPLTLVVDGSTITSPCRRWIAVGAVPLPIIFIASCHGAGHQERQAYLLSLHPLVSAMAYTPIRSAIWWWSPPGPISPRPVGIVRRLERRIAEGGHRLPCRDGALHHRHPRRRCPLPYEECPCGTAEEASRNTCQTGREAKKKKSQAKPPQQPKVDENAQNRLILTLRRCRHPRDGELRVRTPSTESGECATERCGVGQASRVRSMS